MKLILTNHLVYPFHSFGGTEKRVYALAKYLSREGVNVKVVSSFPDNFVRAVVYDNIAYEFIPPRLNLASINNYSPSTIYSLAMFSYNLSKYLHRQQFDVLHSHLTDPYFYLRSKKRQPVVFQPWEEIHVTKLLSYVGDGYAWRLKSSLFGPLKSLVDQSCMTNSDAVASEDESQSKIFMERFHVGAEKIFDLPIGVDIEYIDSLLKEGTLVREDLGVKDSDFVVVSVNRFEPSKGITYLIDALADIKSKIPDVKLILIGTGSQELVLKNQIRNLNLCGSVIHLKNVSEEKLYQILSLSDVYVSPSLDLISVMSLAEAMACGLPIVSTGQQKWVKDNVNGFVVEKRSPERISEAVVRIYDFGLETSLGSSSRALVAHNDYRLIAKKALAQYERLLQVKKSPHPEVR